MVPGGVDTFIRGLIRYSPDDIEFSLVGMTTDPVARPVGRWSQGCLSEKEFDILPVVRVDDAGARKSVPLSARYSLGVIRYWKACRDGFDVYDLHRVEPGLLFLCDPRPKNAVFHTDMAVIRDEPKADILWRKLPTIYFALENAVMREVASVWTVREPAVESLVSRYPFMRGRIHYTPTWVDTDVFMPMADVERHRLRTEIEKTLNLSCTSFRLISVGRLDSSKDPQLLVSAMSLLEKASVDIELLVVGDGVLRRELEQRVASLGLDQRVRFLGLKSPTEIARLLNAADGFVLSSAYEGMPMAMLEALGTGLPVVVTQVGEIARVVVNGRNGQITRNRSAEALADGIREVVRNKGDYAAADCVASVAAFTPAGVLPPIYENYRRLAREHVRVGT